MGRVKVQLHTFLTSALDGMVSGQLHARPLYPRGRSSWYTLDRRLGCPRAGLDAVAKRKIPSACRESNPGSLAPRLIAVQTELSWLQPRYLMTIILPFYGYRFHQVLFRGRGNSQL